MALDNDIDLLARQALLGMMPREALRLLAFSAETRFLRTGDVLFRKGEVADCGYVVVTGAVALDARDDGSPAAEIAGPGYLLGETALFAELARPATALARETSTVMRLPRTVMARVLSEFPDAAAAIHDAIAGRVRTMAHQLQDVRQSMGSIDR